MDAKVTYRPVERRDGDLLLAWRNDPVTRLQSLDQNPVAPEVHEQWLADSLGMSTRQLLIIERDAMPAGVLRFDADDTRSVEVSIHLAPAVRYQGLGAMVLKQAGALAKAWRPETVQLTARVRGDNVASVNAFRKSDFHETNVREDIVYYCRKLDVDVSDKSTT